MHDDVGLLESAIADINGLGLQGLANWQRAASAIQKIAAVIDGRKKERAEQEETRRQEIEEARRAREQAKAEAAARGEEIVGGETVQINADGTQEVLIP